MFCKQNSEEIKLLKHCNSLVFTVWIIFLNPNYLSKSFLAIIKLIYFISSFAVLTFRPYSLMSKDVHLFFSKLYSKYMQLTFMLEVVREVHTCNK